MSYVAYPTDDLTTGISMTNQDAAYPATNAINDDPVEGGVGRPAKSTTTSTTFTLTTGTAVPEAIFLINHNWAGATVTLDGVSIPIPARGADGQCINAWLPLAGTGVAGAASHSLVVTGTTTNAAIGRIFLSSHLRTLDVLWELKFRKAWHDSPIMTIGGKNIVYNKGFKNRALEGKIITADALEILDALATAAQGRNLPWPLVPYPAENDALWVTFIENALVWQENALDVAEATVAVEQWMGLPL